MSNSNGSQGGKNTGNNNGGNKPHVATPRPPNGPSTTGRPSGDGRGNNPPKK